ncbi:uncharacterized protein LOC112515873 [Cynara cardunculus var. scolymus]|uniref:Uncharacterized protein n=1 Tax=Cynara cardunculus var. scolymus TaxID=59895 RepID=A0A118JV00_CYNCS|nr:uncharacterized protein LOC112515873 [Cynara cardunculus var. scolymus]KVH92874.1 hypothetical protein Ccrd_005175 [Cynara cardunculus var. scolymus]
MEMQLEVDELGFSPSFNCYFSDSLTSTTATAAAKVSREFMQEQAAQFREFSDVDEEDFEFSLVLDDEEVSGKQISVQRSPTTADVDFPVGETDTASSVHIQIQKLFVNGGEASSFSSTSESEESDDRPSGSFCIWRPKSYVVSSTITKCKKSSSAGSGSGSRRWRRILDLLRRSNSEGKESMFLLRSKKIKSSKQNRKVSPVEVTRVAGKLKEGSSPSFHGLFYAQKRAEKEGHKMKSFLPYRQDLLGFFVNIHRIGHKKSTF